MIAVSFVLELRIYRDSLQFLHFEGKMAPTYFTTMPQPRYTIESLTAKAEDHRDSILPTDASTTVIDVSHVRDLCDRDFCM